MMDVCGVAPTAPRGELFRRKNAVWFVLTNYVMDVAPRRITRKCKVWFGNDGDGLTAKDALALADCLESEMRSGRTSISLLARNSLCDEPILYHSDIEEFAAFLRASGGFEIY